MSKQKITRQLIAWLLVAAFAAVPLWVWADEVDVDLQLRCV